MKNYTFLFAALFAILFTSCVKEELHETPTFNNNDLTVQNQMEETFLDVSPKLNIGQYLKDEDNFSIFYDALVHTGLTPILNTNNITVFAPNNTAMSKLLAKGNYATVKEFPPSQLKTIMMCHISINGEYVLDGKERGQDIQLYKEGEMVYMRTTDATLHLNSSISNIYIVNKQQTNGILHLISSVMIP